MRTRFVHESITQPPWIKIIYPLEKHVVTTPCVLLNGSLSLINTNQAISLFSFDEASNSYYQIKTPLLSIYLTLRLTSPASEANPIAFPKPTPL